MCKYPRSDKIYPSKVNEKPHDLLDHKEHVNSGNNDQTLP
jgi:hypothetical protein